MNNIPYNPEEIPVEQFFGFHQYVLNDPAHLCFVSRSLCGLLLTEPDELLHEKKDLYAQHVHPADRAMYCRFLNGLLEKESEKSLDYRLVKKDKTTIYVRDTLMVKRHADGTVTASSVLTDITDIKKENENLRFLNETIPCGFMKYTCEKQPRITYLNQTMINMMRFSEVKDSESDYLDLYKSNIFLMIPMEERRRFSKYLNKVYWSDRPLAGEMDLQRLDGTTVHIFGWVTKSVNERGEEEFQSVCIDITARHEEKEITSIKKYLNALAKVYDIIFEFQFDNNTVKCLHCSDRSYFKRFKDIAMRIDDAAKKWITDPVDEEDKPRLEKFFNSFLKNELNDNGTSLPQITYKAMSADGEYKKYSGVFIKVNKDVTFFCCRKIIDTAAAEVLKTENDRLKNLVMRFTDGLAAFEITTDGLVKPLYASENVCEFFGYTSEKWTSLMEKGAPIKEFVAYSEASFEAFDELLQKGEAQFSYFDYKTERTRQIVAVCSQKEPDNSSPRFVMLYSVPDAPVPQTQALPENRVVSVRTFGYFDVFIGEKPIAFRNKKAKELLALLVDRRGGFLTSQEAIGYLWEDEPANPVTHSRYRKVALRLKNTLEEYGISHIIETVDGKRRIVPENISCDLYDYLSGKDENSALFKGSYLSNYSWGEITLGELISGGKFSE